MVSEIDNATLYQMNLEAFFTNFLLVSLGGGAILKALFNWDPGKSCFNLSIASAKGQFPPTPPSMYNESPIFTGVRK